MCNSNDNRGRVYCKISLSDKCGRTRSVLVQRVDGELFYLTYTQCGCVYANCRLCTSSVYDKIILSDTRWHTLNVYGTCRWCTLDLFYPAIVDVQPVIVYATCWWELLYPAVCNVWWWNLNTDVQVVCTIKLFYPTNVDIHAVCIQTVGDVHAVCVHYNYFIR